jgi:hypothetical protein
MSGLRSTRSEHIFNAFEHFTGSFLPVGVVHLLGTSHKIYIMNYHYIYSFPMRPVKIFQYSSIVAF